MTYQNEKQLSSRASQFPIEEYYTNIDVNPNEDVDPRVGFTYDFPVRWANDPSLNKAIGIRRLDCVPTSHCIALKINYYDPTVVDSRISDYTLDEDNSMEGVLSITAKNNLEEIMSYLCSNWSNDKYVFSHYYSPDGELYMLAFCRTKNVYTRFSFSSARLNDEWDHNDIDEFLKFLNQKVNDENENALTAATDDKYFSNVWDRDNLEFHASFSTSKRGFIGLKGDFYPNISYIFNQGTDSPQFQLRFTTNGKDPILPLYCHYICQLTFILNYKKSLVT